MFPLTSSPQFEVGLKDVNFSLSIGHINLTDYDDEMCEKEDVVQFGSLVTPIFLSVVTILSVTGNILVLVILALYENLKSLTNIFILNLAISDLIFTFGLPFWAFYHIWGWQLPEALCPIVNFVFYTGFYSSILCLTIMTIYRYMVVVSPLSDLCTPKLHTGIFLTILMWMISVAGAMPSALHTSIVKIYHNDQHSLGCEYETVLWEHVSTYQQNIFFLFAFGVMTFCNVGILLKIRQTKSRTKHRAVKLVFCIVTVFFVGWVPYNVVIFLRVLLFHVKELTENCDLSFNLDYAFYVSRLIAFSHCCLNPVLYAFVGTKFRSHLKTLMHQLSKPRTPIEEQPTRMQNLISHGSIC